MFEKEIAVGVQYMDERYPDWLQDTSVDRLAMHNGDSCLIAQNEHRPFTYWVQEQGKTDDECITFAVERGLTVQLNDNDQKRDFGSLSKEWRAKILQLRDERG